MEGRVLFIDDQELHTEQYVKELSAAGFEVTFISDVDKALQVFSTDPERFDTVILDLMLPPGRTFSEDETDFGLTTGDLMHSRIRERDDRLPIIILTNRQSPRVPDSIRHDEGTTVLAKLDCLPVELVEHVSKVTYRKGRPR